MKVFVEADLAETVPDGTFGRSRPRPGRPTRAWTREEQDEHWEALCAATGTRSVPRPGQAPKTPHTGTQTP